MRVGIITCLELKIGKTMEQFDEKTLIDFHQNNGNKQVHLWTMYVVATMAAAGFGVATTGKLNIWVAIMACFGFLTFTIGHAWMIYYALNVQASIENQMKKTDLNESNEINKAMIHNSLNWKGALCTHIPIDMFVLGIILYTPVSDIIRNLC